MDVISELLKKSQPEQMRTEVPGVRTEIPKAPKPVAKSVKPSAAGEAAKAGFMSKFGGPAIYAGTALASTLLSNAAEAKRARKQREFEGEMRGLEMQQRGTDQITSGSRASLDSLMNAYKSALLS